MLAGILHVEPLGTRSSPQKC